MARCAGYGLEVEGMWFVVALIGLLYYGIRIFLEKIDGLDAMLEKMFLCVATLQVENAHTVVPTCRAVREGWGRLLQNTQQTKEIVSEMNFQLKLREEDAVKG